jgi:hypothetical protein
MARGIARLARVPAIRWGCSERAAPIESARSCLNPLRIDGLCNGGTIGMGHHVPSILNEVQDGTGQRPV